MISSDSGLSIDASRLSTEFMRYAFAAAISASESFPLKTYTRAHATFGRLNATICTHCSAESARWSNCPGRYSIANAFSPSASGNAPS